MTTTDHLWVLSPADLAALIWLIGPAGLAVTVAVVLALTWRREFASHSRNVMLRDLPRIGRG